MKKKAGIGSILIGMLLIGNEVADRIMANQTVCIIGGADGPTSIFLAGKIGWFKYSGLVTGILLLMIGIGLVCWKKKIDD
ncbi:hypothetical protein [[Clostridium] polysaccharolyticum]|uniref:Uncharacterized protein n=1 Tax=[Clostridium] polysaccharolyticum TaxID=29364 RepID=A0A1I0BFM1_9FIRM|nr:hypothetical protein [[Clostridium] polysaccharolyticum]SET05684.1 hypothetical protein SAMN04487772_107112 [[Clostridium] polysaccharolyticum]